MRMMDSITLRSTLANAIPFLSFAAFVGYGIYGFYLDLRVQRYLIRRPPPGTDALDASNFHPDAAPELAKLLRMRRIDTWVWLGCVVMANVLYFWISP